MFIIFITKIDCEIALLLLLTKGMHTIILCIEIMVVFLPWYYAAVSGQWRSSIRCRPWLPLKMPPKVDKQILK